MSKKLIPLIIFMVLLLSGFSENSDYSENSRDTLSEATAYLQSEMDGLQIMLGEIGASVGQMPANDEKAYELLNAKLNSKNYLYDIIVCDKDTNVLNVSTKIHADFIGLNRGKNDRYAELFQTYPVFTIKPNTAADDSPYIYCSVPIKNGGWVIAYIDPYSLEAEISALAIGENVSLGVIDTVGTNVSAANMTEIGKNVLTDDMYSGFPELQSLIRDKMIPNAQGSGEYTYYASGMGSPVNKKIEWDTIHVFDKDLRVYVNTEPAAEDANTDPGEHREFNAAELLWLDSAKATVESEFSQLSALNNAAIGKYQEYGEESKEFAQSLTDISKESIIAKNIYFVNADNFISKAYPKYLAGNLFDIYGENIPGYSKNTEPFIFDFPIPDSHTYVFRMLGFAFPVEKDGKLAGWIISQVRLYDLAAYLTKLENIGHNVNFMLVNDDGTVLYDGDVTEVGKNCLTDELYTKNVNDFIKNEFMAKSEGKSQYEFYGAGMTAVIPKNIVWKTISFMGKDFKISMNSEWVMNKQ